MEVGSETWSLRLVPDLRLSNLEFRGTTNLDHKFAGQEGRFTPAQDSQQLNTELATQPVKIAVRKVDPVPAQDSHQLNLN